MGISETHVEGHIGQHFFFRHVADVHAFHEGGMSLLVRKEWANTSGVEAPHGEQNGSSFHVVISGVMHALRFSTAGRDGWVVHLRLDAHSNANRVSQLDRAATWMKNNVKAGEVVIFGGDRNHTLTEEERATTGRTRRRTTAAMRNAWHGFMESFGGRIVSQPEFTWYKIGKRCDDAGEDDEDDSGEEEEGDDDDSAEEEEDDDDDDEAAEAERAYAEAEAAGRGDGQRWQAAILDVAGANVDRHGVGGWQAVSRRADWLPHPRTASDHRPVELRWVRKQWGRRGAGAQQPGERKVQRTLPEWLFANQLSTEELMDTLEAWWQTRPQGGAALQEFAEITHATGTCFMKERIIEAQTTRHRLDVAIATLTHLQARADGRISRERVDRYCTIYPRLTDCITFIISGNELGLCRVDESSVAEVRRVVEELTRELEEERAEEELEHEENAGEEPTPCSSTE